MRFAKRFNGLPRFLVLGLVVALRCLDAAAGHKVVLKVWKGPGSQNQADLDGGALSVHR